MLMRLQTRLIDALLSATGVSARLRAIRDNVACLVREESWPAGTRAEGDEVSALERQLEKAASLLVLRNQAVHRTHETFNRFFMLSLDLFCVAGFDGYFKRINRAWSETLGWSEEEFLTRPFIDFVHPDDREATLMEGEKLASGGVVVSFENRYRCRDGTFRWLQWAAVSYVEQATIHAVARDVTASKEAETRARTMTTELERRNVQLTTLNEELEAFSYSVSHDLRAPLRSVDGFSQILLEDYGDRLDAEGKDALQRVRNAAVRMGELIDAMLALSRLSRVELRFEPVDLSALVHAIAADLCHAHPERCAEFIVTSGLAVMGDPRLLRAALENLVSNAWKYTEPRAVARIEFGCVNGDDEAIYFVRDNGVGFDMNYVDKLFGAFQRLHRQGEFGGTGIGLATVQRIVHRHGGRTWANGVVDHGATFYFTLANGTAPGTVVLDAAETIAGVS